ncbi:hypothetical protein ACIBEJ_48690 [Nonomuraea sp. NPDC050790]|uniref:hypothetical protein n=1 Tax=Nonomuraea sp. NPDC050790 TaxID=3364371 RepID=UPI0037997598
MNAILAMLDGALPANVGVFWAQAVPDAARPYAVLYPDVGMESTVDRSLADDVPNDLRFQVTCVGDAAQQAAWLADKVAAILLTTVPAVAGRRVRPIRQEGAQPVRRDDESTALFIATAQYLARSDRTT